VSQPTRPQFLDQRSYRRKRLIDAARLLPVVGAAALVFPLPFLFIDHVLAADAAPMALYLFGVWLVLIIGAAALARFLDVATSDD